MSKQTTKYKLGYFETGDTTSAITEMQRWETLDAQLYSIFSLMGNGTISGWSLQKSDGLAITITPGSGHVAFVAVESTENETITNLTPSTRNYIYAQLASNSYWTKNVDFAAYVTTTSSENSLLIGYVDTNETSVTAINTDDKTELGYIALVKNYIKDHRHIGGTDNPPPIDLASEVQGIINQANLPDLDASVIKSGTIDENVLPEISHDLLSGKGALSHAQIDSLLETLSNGKEGLLGEVAIVNLMQLVLALKHVYPNIDDYLLNSISIIPGITPDEYIDFVNSTADIDVRTYAEGGQHTITGPASTGREIYTKTWDEAADYTTATLSETILDQSAISLDTYEQSLVLDDFSDINNWSVVTNDTSSLSAEVQKDATNYVSLSNSAKINILGQEVELLLLVKKTFSPQDWSSYKYIKFYLKTASLNHGDLFFYIRDSVSGVQNSYTKVLDKNKPTINVDTLENGWEEITIDLSSYTKSSVEELAFMMSTQDGWDTSRPFAFNVDDIKLTSGNVFKDNGYIRMKFENNIPCKWDKVRWLAVAPTGTDLKYRARFANTEGALTTAIWTDYLNDSGETMGLDDDELFKNIEIELYLSSSTDNLSSPYVQKIFLDFYVIDSENSFDITSQDDWKAGQGFNLDLTSSPGDLKVADLDSIGKTFYGADGEIVQLDSSYSQDWSLKSTSLPLTTYQALNGSKSSLGLITAIDRGELGNLWICDVDNDRVLEIDQAGNLVRGFYGSFLKDPEDVYGEEESGPGSNIYSSETYKTDFDSVATNSAPDYSLSILHSIYNPNTGTLYVVFNKNIENIYASNKLLDLNKFYMKIGTQIFYLYNATSEIFNVDETQYNNWIEFYKSTEDIRTGFGQHMRQFSFTGHVLELTLSNSEKIAINKIVREENPIVTISSPCNNKVTNSSPLIKLITNNFDIGTSVSENHIKVTIDDTTEYEIFENQLGLSGLTSGLHSIKVELIDEDGDVYDNVGASFETNFVVGSASNPVLEITGPKPNQIFTSTTIGIDFNIQNFPILESGQHIKYKINGVVSGDHYSTETLYISDLDYGLNSIELYLVDENGNDLDLAYGNVIISIIIGKNPNALVTLHCKKDAIQSFDKNSRIARSNSNVDVANIKFANIFSPIDLQVIKDVPANNETSYPTILISKLRSPSSINGLGDSIRVTELTNRIYNSTNPETKKEELAELEDIETEKLIYNGIFHDGHSVVELGLDGSMIFSNNLAKFANTKVQAKNILGSAKKISVNEVLVGDAINKRAAISYTDISNEKVDILWEYMSDRHISDAIIGSQNTITINVYDGSVDLSNLSIVPGTSIVWKNMSSVPVTIYSGKTTESQFDQDPDLNNYGDDFQSDLLNVGDSFTHRFDGEGSFDWFVYSSIITGNVQVSRQRLSPNDLFYLIENDGLDSPFTSRVVKIDAWGNVVWAFGEGYLVKPRDVRLASDNKLIIST